MSKKEEQYNTIVTYRDGDGKEKSKKFSGQKGSLAQKLHSYKDWSDSSNAFMRVEGNDGSFVIAKHEIILIHGEKSQN